MLVGRSTGKWLGARDVDVRGFLLVVLAAGWLAGIVLSAWIALPALVWLIAAGLALCGVGFFWSPAKPLHYPRADTKAAWTMDEGLGAQVDKSAHENLSRRFWLLVTPGRLYWNKPDVFLLALVLLCLCLGAWRYTMAAPGNDPAAIRNWLGAGKVTLQGSIADEPRLETRTTLLTVTVQQVSRDQGTTWQEAHGTISVQVLGATFDDAYGPRYGDNVQLAGQLSASASYSTPEIQASMLFPRLIIESRGGNPLLVTLYQWRTTLAGILQQALPQPFAALLIAIFLSLRTPALKPLLSFFNVTGTAHLIAPSGFKVTLLAGVITGGTNWLVPKRGPQDWQLLPAERRRGNWRRWLRTGLVILGIAVYTFLSGGGAAALRAGIMGCLLVLAPRLERTYNVYNALAFSALIMSLLDPLSLWDTGFQLSFLGTLGIVLFTPFFQHLLRFLHRLPPGFYVGEMIATTLAAQVATLPIFATSFQQISFVAPFANIATVPLLGLLLSLGALICLSGLFSLHLALLVGWLAWPLLWYVGAVVTWCAHIPGAYFTVTGLNPLLAWGYYVLLGCLVVLMLRRWQPGEQAAHPHAPLPRPMIRALQGGLALLILLTTGAMAQAAQANSTLTITLLNGGQSNEGQALLVHSADGAYALFDEDADSATLTQVLDAQMPFWQRTLNLVVLTDTSASNLASLQNVVGRYSVGQVVDAGMLHPSVAYARWRRTLVERGIAYTQVRQGASVTLGRQIALQVLWPPAQLHKGSDETHDNALILRLLAPGLRLILLNSAALSAYALRTLTESVDASYLQAQIVQLSGAAGKAFAPALASLLTSAHPSLLILTGQPATKQKQNEAVPAPPAGSWQTLDASRSSTLAIRVDERGWSVDTT